MGMKYAISGNNTSAVAGTGTLTPINLMGRNIPDNKIFWLKEAWFYNITTGVNIFLYDLTEGATVTASKIRAVIPTATQALTTRIWSDPGLKFETGCGVVKATTNASGAFAIGYMGGNGFEEE